MDWDAVGQGILRYGRWREIFLGMETRWWQVGPVYENMLGITVQFKERNGDNL